MKLLALLLVLGALPWLMACTDQPRPAMGTSVGNPPGRITADTRDPHSFSHPDEVAVEHLKLDLNVDFRTETARRPRQPAPRQPHRRRPPLASTPAT